MSAELDAVIDARAKAIRETRVAAATLNHASEELRKAIDGLDVAFGNLLRNDVFPTKRERMFDRLLSIRRARNGMETFALQCLVNEACDTAWKELP